jgi:hypothetical protein
MPNEVAKLEERPASGRLHKDTMAPHGWAWPNCNAVIHWTAALALLMTAICSEAPAARAAEDGALKILKGMSDYLASQKTISLS